MIRHLSWPVSLNLDREKKFNDAVYCFRAGHEVTVDACLEGTTDVIPHTEKFLVEYKLFAYDTASGYIRHTPSGMCVTPGEETSSFQFLC